MEFLGQAMPKFHMDICTFLTDLIDKNPCITVNMATEELCQMLQGLRISESVLRKHMKEKVRLALKSSSIYPMDKDATRIIGLHYKIITECKAVEVDFQNNSVFIDKAGFNSHQTTSRTWSVKGTPAQVEVPTQKGVNFRIVGCMSPFGTIKSRTIVAFLMLLRLKNGFISLKTKREK